jgi:hypothetical protein
MITQDELLRLLRSELPKLLQSDPLFRAQVIGVMSEVLVTKGELAQLLEEMRAMRAESEKRFDQVDQRFEAVDQRFDQVDQRFDHLEQDVDRRFTKVEGLVARLIAGLGSLGSRMGPGLEDVVRQVVESFSGLGPLQAHKFVLTDETGEFRMTGAQVEFDALITDGRKFLVEVKSHADEEEIWLFYQKCRFAEMKLNEAFEKVLIAPSASHRAVEVAKQIGITCYVYSLTQ